MRRQKTYPDHPLECQTPMTALQGRSRSSVLVRTHTTRFVTKSIPGLWVFEGLGTEGDFFDRDAVGGIFLARREAKEFEILVPTQLRAPGGFMKHSVLFVWCQQSTL